VAIKKTILFAFLSLCVLSFSWSGYKFPKLNNDNISYDDLIASSSHTVIFLWTSYCPYCREELKKLNRYKPASKAVFYYVNIGDGKRVVERVSDMLNLKESIRDNVLLDKEGVTADAFGIIGVPTYVFLNKGKVVYKSHFIDDSLLKKVFKENEK